MYRSAITHARLMRESTDRVETALHGSEERLRSRVRPILLDAFSDVGLEPASPPEQELSWLS